MPPSLLNFGGFGMGFIGAAIGAVSSIAGGLIKKKAAKKAAKAQAASMQMGIDELARQFNITDQRAQPFSQAGTGAIQAQSTLAGLNGTADQQSAINALLASPEYASLINEGETGILQNASATGGLRGGNTQNSLARFRAATLSGLINDQFSRLGSISNLGAQTTLGVGGLGAQNASSIAQLYAGQGQAKAGGILGGASAFTEALNNLSGIAGGFKTGGVVGVSPGGVPTGTPPIVPQVGKAF